MTEWTRHLSYEELSRSLIARHVIEVSSQIGDSGDL